jgi:hypothetical protein
MIYLALKTNLNQMLPRPKKRSAFRQTFFKQTLYFPIVLRGDICNLVTPDGALAYANLRYHQKLWLDSKHLINTRFLTCLKTEALLGKTNRILIRKLN